MYMLVIVTARKRSWGKVIFSEACVKNFVHGRLGGLPHCMLGYTPPDQRLAPPGPGAGTHTPDQEQPPPPGTDTPLPRRYGQQAGGAHPTGMQSCSWLHLCSTSFKNPYTLGSTYYELSYYEYSGYKSIFFSQKGKLWHQCLKSSVSRSTTYN